ncbi:MAG: 4-(cytidine 5'-diphospho)-2-C-methyl-D-erythritol kinase [Clostridia bacterium]|nr:4-(cytidine 5'-diphospho)-2-C-methyl-D-erythritol kinase [Clostridia bacterium]MBR3865769.1 4-(cytidine 5'-diphospho)-2-C-methyl-D-erythritol kinase [Clostridia bacterium]
MECRACAKLNLYLDITGIMPDGYHALRSVMQSIDLYDTVKVEKADTIRLTVDKKYIPTDERNTAFKAAKAFFEATGIQGGAEIFIKKIIPVGAGMAGGSADAAAVLNLLNILYGMPLSAEELSDVALKVGADVPFCLEGGTMLAEGKGEKLTPLPKLAKCFFVVVKPFFSVSTKDAYKMFDEQGGDCPNVDGILSALEQRNIHQVCSSMGNDLERCIASRHPEINEIKDKLIGLGAIGAMMTGSGSAVFGVFENMIQAQQAADKMRAPKRRVFVCRPV